MTPIHLQEARKKLLEELKCKKLSDLSQAERKSFKRRWAGYDS